MAGLLVLASGLARGLAAPNAQLRRLNLRVGEALRGGAACALPTGLAAMGRGGEAGLVGGVSSFGYSGTIAHAVLQSASGVVDDTVVPLPRLTYRRRHFGWSKESPAAATAKHLRQRLAASRAAELALDAVLLPGRIPPSTADVLVIGAGLAGLIVASRFAQAGARVVVLERSAQVGGVWRQHANPLSRVNSSEPSYRVPARRAAPNTNHSHHSEILVDALRLLRGEVETPINGTPDEAISLAHQIFLGCEVCGVQEAPAGQQQPSPSSGWCVVGVCGAGAVPFEVRSGTVVVCTNRRLGVPRSLTLKGEADFLGAMRRGLAGDCEDVHWHGQRVVSLGIESYTTLTTLNTPTSYTY
eukprot:scaffold17244_cov84-Phaeocystis_antarctica.AAC.1